MWKRHVHDLSQEFIGECRLLAQYLVFSDEEAEMSMDVLAVHIFLL